MAYVIDQINCSACHQCRVECPIGAITFRNAKYWIDPEKCVSCGSCVKVCHNGCISDPEHPAPPAVPHEKISKSCDICVVGGGGAGMVAAAKAVDEGLKVILLEKNHEIGGSAWYAAGFRVHYSKWHQEAGLEDNTEKMVQQFMEKTEGKVDEKFVRRMFKANTDFANWMIDEHDLGKDYTFTVGPMGGMMKGTYEWERAGKRIDKMIGPGEGGWYVTSHLEKSILEKGGEILLKTSGKKLLTNEAGEVVGILAEDEGGQIEISCKAVVLTTGAFTRNRELMEKFQPMFYDDAGKEPVHIFTGSGCTGDGITMSMELGADVDYENRRVNLFGPMRHPYPCVSLNIAMGVSGVQFGSQGNPYKGALGMTEVSDLAYDPKRYCWKVVDDAIAETVIDGAMKEPPQSPGMDLGKFMANWRDVLAEEEVAGSIVSAATLPELAAKLGFDEKDFMAQIEAYNEETRKPKAPKPKMPPMGEGGEMDMMAMMMMNRPDPQAVEKGPFYAIKLKLFHEDAIGGVVTNEHANVMKDGKPIAGLFAAGDTTRGVILPGDIGVGYIESVFSALTQAFTEGYMAGDEAVMYVK